MKDYKYLFSVVVPVYNTELYLEECIESIVNQTIGFANIQLILINNASTDNSFEICLKYKSKYPYNVVVNELKENSGPDIARHMGFKYVEGRYTYSCDSDDRLSLDMFDQVYKFFENNNVNIILIPAKYFEAKSGWVEEFYENWETGVKDIEHEEYYGVRDYWRTFFSSKLFKKLELFKPPYNEYTGQLFLKYLLISERYFGYISTAIYYYRKRYSGNSIIDQLVHSDLVNLTIFNLNIIFRCLTTELLRVVRGLYSSFPPSLKKEIYNYMRFIFYSLDFDIMSNFYEEAIFKLRTFLNLVVEFEDLLDDRSIINIFPPYINLFLLNLYHKEIDEKSNKINIKNLIKKGIIKDDVKEYCFLQCEQVILDEYKNVLVEFYISCPIDINIERTIGEGNNGFEREANLEYVEDVKIWNEVCFKIYKYILKIDKYIALGQTIKFWLEINRIQYASNLIIDLE